MTQTAIPLCAIVMDSNNLAEIVPDAAPSKLEVVDRSHRSIALAVLYEVV